MAICADRAGEGDAPHREEIADGEVHPNPEHQQDHAEFGQLGRDLGVADEAGGEWPDRDPGQQVADDRWQAQARGDEADRKSDDNPTAIVAIKVVSCGIRQDFGEARSVV